MGFLLRVLEGNRYNFSVRALGLSSDVCFRAVVTRPSGNGTSILELLGAWARPCMLGLPPRTVQSHPWLTFQHEAAVSDRVHRSCDVAVLWSSGP